MADEAKDDEQAIRVVAEGILLGTLRGFSMASTPEGGTRLVLDLDADHRAAEDLTHLAAVSWPGQLRGRVTRDTMHGEPPPLPAREVYAPWLKLDEGD